MLASRLLIPAASSLTRAESSGSNRAIAVAEAVTFAQPVPLSELRRRHSSFVTPQSYRFLASDEMAALLNGQAGDLASLIETPSLCAPIVSSLVSAPMR